MINILNLINFVVIDYFYNFGDFVTLHFTQMVLYLEIGEHFICFYSEIEIILIFPFHAIQLKLLFSNDTFVLDALLAYYL